MSEVIFFVEQVTGHLIPDFRYVIKKGTKFVAREIEELILKEKEQVKVNNLRAMKRSLIAVETFANRYSNLARKQLSSKHPMRKKELEHIIKTLEQVPVYGARTLF